MQWQTYWQQLQPREQHLIQILAAVIAVLFIYSVIVSPFNASRAELEQDVQDRRSLLQTVNNAAQQQQRIGNARTNESDKSTSLLPLVQKTINQQQLTASMKAINEKGRNGLVVDFDDVSFDAVNTWLLSLSQQHAIKVVSLNATARGNNTGQVDLQVELKH